MNDDLEETLPTGGARPDRVRDQSVEKGAVIDYYRLLERVGEGGMGEVWLAEQLQPVRRKVALKVIRKGMDTDEVVARFEQERQALAMMDHPAIAKVFDAGATPRGRPYFVMEYVSGVPITDYCDDKRLNMTERLELFIQVCEGVQHAHQKAIIHRDLKPSNVLVTEQDDRPVPKIIDFGVAKATANRLTDRTMHTELGEMLGTPEYMSPEQAEMTGLNIDTRTDVYALGIMLYKLLVGELPFDAKALRALSFDDMRRAIREEEAPRPSTRVTNLGKAGASAEIRRIDATTLSSQLKGDLDWIVMKAIEKERSRRYPSPSELAAEIRRFLANEPIEARPPSATYRMQKFVRRHKVGTGAAATLLTVLIAFAVTMTVQANRIARERDRANQEAETARQVSDWLERLFEVSDPGEARGNTITAREILDQGAADIEAELADQPLVQARLMNVMGRVYKSLGLYDDARPLLERALALRQGDLDDDPLALAPVMNDLGRLLAREGKYEDARRLLVDSLAIYEREAGPESEAVADGLNSLGDLELRERNYDAARPLLERSLAIFEVVLGPDHFNVALPLNNLAIVYRRAGDIDRARRSYERALRVSKKARGPAHPDVANILTNLATMLMRAKEYDASQRYFEQALAIREKTLGPDHPDIATLLNNLGNLHHARGDHADHDQARALHERALAIREKALGEEHPEVAQSLQNLAMVVTEQGLYDEAEALYRRALAVREATMAPDHPTVAVNYYNLAGLSARRGEREQALALLATAMERGFANRLIAEDTDFDSLRGEPEFEAIVAEVEARAAAR